MLVAAYLAHAVAGSVEQLALMGFDLPRAHLIAALTLGSCAAAVAVLITGDRRSGALLGLIGLIAFFGLTFIDETTTAVNSSGLDGVFDPVGYTFSVFTFVLMSVVFAWSAGALAVEVRRSVLRTWRRVQVSRQVKKARRYAFGRALASVAVAVALAASFTLFAQMINYVPDIAFVTNGPAVGGLTDDLDLPTAEPSGDSPQPSNRPSGGTPAPGSSASPGTSLSPGDATGFQAVPIEAGGTVSITPGAVADLARGHFTPLSGTSQVIHSTLPAPWTGGYATTVDIYVRLPAGYDPVHQRYPTVYVTPNPYADWTDAVHLNSTVDALEAAGDIPPMIYVFAPATGGPYPVTQCVDSKDGTQKWDTFMSTTLIAWVDSKYATIAEPAARTIMGDSQGGYCAADLLLRHPQVWNQEISFVGYYDASPRTPGHEGGAEVFGGDQSMMDAYSPITIAPTLPVAVKQKLFFVLTGNSSEVFYGPWLDRFSGILDQNGYSRAVIETPYGHSWKTEEAFLPRSLLLIGERLVKQGVLQ